MARLAKGRLVLAAAVLLLAASGATSADDRDPRQEITLRQRRLQQVAVATGVSPVTTRTRTLPTWCPRAGA